VVAVVQLTSVIADVAANAINAEREMVIDVSLSWRCGCHHRLLLTGYKDESARFNCLHL
jgi:hypothetical protein